MSTKHTLGPWKLMMRIPGGTPVIRTDDGALEVCEVHIEDEPGRPLPYEANARLIAAAPELLAALKLVQSILCEQCPCGDFETHGTEHTDECMTAMDAIEKAEGNV
jgi:hypothetical protein